MSKKREFCCHWVSEHSGTCFCSCCMACGCAALLSISWPPVRSLLLRSRLAHPTTDASGTASSPSPATLMQTPHPQRTHNLCGPVRRMMCSATVSVPALCVAGTTCLKVAGPGGRLSNQHAGCCQALACSTRLGGELRHQSWCRLGAAMQCCDLQQPGHAQAAELEHLGRC